MGQVDAGRHHVLAGPRHPAQLVERPLHGVVVAVGSPLGQVGHGGRAHRRVDLEDVVVALEGGGGGLGELVDADHHQLAGFDLAHALGVAAHEPTLQLVDGLERPAERQHVVQLGLGLVDQRRGLGLDHVGSGEDVVVLQQVGLEGQHLLDAQRPLLVPGAGQAQGLVPRRELERPGPGVARQGDAERLEHDALHVVLGLGLGEPQAVHLHAVAEAAGLGVGDAVALLGDAVPHLGEGPHLAGLLHEADAGVHEEADRRDHVGHAVLGDLPRRLHGVEHVDGRGQGVGDLLDRRGPGLLQVVAADVHRVPVGDPLLAEREHVHDQPAGRQRRVDVGAAAQVLLDDVVLGGAAQQLGLHALLLGVGHVEPEHPGRHRVDGHRRVHLAHGDAAEQRLHVADVRHGHAHLAHLAAGHGIVAVVARLGGQVEGDGEARLALGQVGAVQLVGGLGGGVARVGPHHPRTVRLALVGHAPFSAVPPSRVTPSPVRELTRCQIWRSP